MECVNQARYNAKQQEAARKRAQAIRVHLAQGKSVIEVAKLYRVTRARIYQLLKRYPEA